MSFARTQFLESSTNALPKASGGASAANAVSGFRAVESQTTAEQSAPYDNEHTLHRTFSTSL
jgi:hypothetical protein